LTKTAATVFMGGAAVLVLSANCGKAAIGGEKAAATEKAKGGFSFAVFGDSRSMMQLPYQQDQEADAREMMVDLFSVVMPRKVSEETVKKYVTLIYDPETKELIQVVMPFMTSSEVTTLTLDKGWVTEASVEDVKLLPGVRRTMFRFEGGDWVARGVVRDVLQGKAKFIMNTGDLAWWASRPRPPPRIRTGPS
jgi:hypothetical protein